MGVTRVILKKNPMFPILLFWGPENSTNNPPDTRKVEKL